MMSAGKLTLHIGLLFAWNSGYFMGHFSQTLSAMRLSCFPSAKLMAFLGGAPYLDNLGSSQI